MQTIERRAPDAGETHSRYLWPALLLITLLAGALRFYHLGAWSMWSDEVASLRDAASLGNVATYPIGYFLIGRAVRLFGDSEFVARFIPALAGTLTAPMLFLVARRLFSFRAGVVAGLLLALSNFHLFYSQYARYYTLLMLFGLLAMWMAFVGMEREDRARLAGAVGWMILAVLTHWSALLLLPALAGYVFWKVWRQRKTRGVPWVNLAILFGPFLLGGLAALPRLVAFVQSWRAPEGFSPGRAAFTALKIADRLDAALLLCAAVGVWLLWRERDRRLRWLLSYAAVPVFLAILFVGFAEGGSRFAFVALPAVILLAAFLLDAVIEASAGRLRMVAWVLVGLVALVSGMKDIAYHTFERGQRPRWREAVAYAATLKTAHQDVFVANAPEVFRYYLARVNKPEAAGQVFPSLESYRAWRRAGDSEEFLPGIAAIAVERVANVAPNAAEQAALDRFPSRKVFPLRVRSLDYSIYVYHAPAPAPSR